MFVGCGVFFFTVDRGCLLGADVCWVWGIFFEIADVC